ncbi:hypothetical protein [Flavobacterium denitrificans]|uniref:hypothetical protein n=1 Tax=Flavobacterium denitrificans TaxID=281361 RepID=UPI00047DE2C9|nr:hypothetical protein [Flavobacterium denitrificans]
MISQLNIEEFRKRLKLNTKLGNPKISGSPLHAFNLIGEKNKLFYGYSNQNDFKITKNAILHPIPFILEGKIKSNNLNQTEVSYKITSIKFGYYWIRYFPIIAFILFNTIFIIEKSPLLVYLSFNTFNIILGSFSNIMMSYKKRKFEKNFKTIFEIDN